MNDGKLPRVALGALAVLGLCAAGPMSRAHWPEHGFYRVDRDVLADGGASCDMKGEVSVRGTAFALVLLQAADAPLKLMVFSGRPGLAQAGHVAIGVDRASVVAFDASAPQRTATGMAVIDHQFPDARSGQQFVLDLAAAAKNAHRLWVRTPAALEAVPADGLVEALTDMQACLGAAPNGG
jgi:hypothetical protein